MDYKKFLKNFTNNVPKKVSNFDSLINELEEKHKDLKYGVIQDTPLTNYLCRQALEKVIFVSQNLKK